MAWTYQPGEWGTPGAWSQEANGQIEYLSDADYQAMLAQQATQATQQQTDWERRAANFVNAQGQSMTALDPAYWKDYNNFQFLATEPTGGADNKYAAIDSWRNSGAYYDPNAGYFGGYYLPNNASQANLVGLYDENPNLDEWQALPIVLGLAGAALGGGLLSGAFGGAGAVGAEALAGGATSGGMIGADAISTMSALSESLGGLGWTETAAALGYASPEALLTAINPAWVSAAGNMLSNVPTSGLTGGSSSAGSTASVAPSSGIPAYDPAAGLSGADYGSSLSYDAAEGLGGGLSGGGGSSGGMFSNSGSATSGLFDSLGNLITGDYSKLISGGLSGLGGLLSGNAATSAAETQSDAIIKAAQIAADAAKFKPVGVTTRFGQSQFGYDANGNLVAAGYGLKPDIKAQQDKLMGVSESALTQYQGAQAATAPMGTAANTMMTLGNNYLGTTPEQQAQKYMQEQLALLSAPRETDMANLQARLNATGRGGLAIGGGSSGALAANPELNAYYNSIRQQDLGLAANATQGGMDYAKFGAGMVGSGGSMLRDMYNTQSAAYDPYKTALGGASDIERLGQNAMDMGINIGAKGTAANAQSGLLMANGLNAAAATMAPANAYSPWGSLLSGAGNAVSQYSNPQQQYKFDPFTGRAL